MPLRPETVCLWLLLVLPVVAAAQEQAAAEPEPSPQESLMRGAFLQPPFICDALADPATYADGTMASMRQLVAGKRYWYFRTEVDLQTQFPVSARTRENVRELVTLLSRRGIQLVVMLQPTRGLMHADELIQPWRGRYPLSAVRDAYLRKAETLRAQGVRVADMEPVLRSDHAREYFFRRDHHWTPYGAEVSARQVARVMLADPGIEALPRMAFETRPDILLRKLGTLNVAVSQVCGNAYGYQWVRGSVTVPAEGAASADALFGEVSVPSIALVGTSNSDNRDDRYKNYNFHGFLQQFLGRDVVNLAMTGGGATGALEDFLYSPSYAAGQFRYLIWELPVNYALGEPEVWRQLLPAAAGGCADRPRLARGAATLPVPGQDQRVEVLANAGKQRQQTAGQGSLILDLTFSHSALKDFYVLAYYDDGQREKVRIRRPGRLDTGRFTLRLDPPGNGSHLLSVLLQPKQPLATPLTVESALCDY
ncbi:MAG: hypothetical protein MI745_14745 [Pseudomonadales bacterium]|nr:hypothetical protein [Pseudomonadales bacterium]